MALHRFTDQEECGQSAVLGQHLEHGRGPARMRPVVEGERHVRVPGAYTRDGAVHRTYEPVPNRFHDGLLDGSLRVGHGRVAHVMPPRTCCAGCLTLLSPGTRA